MFIAHQTNQKVDKDKANTELMPVCSRGIDIHLAQIKTSVMASIEGFCLVSRLAAYPVVMSWQQLYYF